MAAPEEPQRVQGLIPGSEEYSSVVGDLAIAKDFSAKSLAVVEQFSRAMIAGDIEAAYTLCAAELRGRMKPDTMAAEFAKQIDRDSDGSKPIDYKPEKIVWVYASDAARARKNKDHDWPKNTPQPTKRVMLNSWLTTEIGPEGQNYGRSITFWVSEEAGGYRIAKFWPLD